MASPPPQKPARDAHQGTQRSRREVARTGAMVTLAVVVTLFAVLNLNEVKVDWIIGSGHAPLIVVIVISALFGILLTYMAERINRRRRR